MKEYRIIIGLRLDKPEYYLGFDAVRPNASDYRSVRNMLRDHLDELEAQATSLRAVLATQEPEEAENLLQDGMRLQITEVVLRPRISAAAYLLRLREVAAETLLSEIRSMGGDAA